MATAQAPAEVTAPALAEPAPAEAPPHHKLNADQLVAIAQAAADHQVEDKNNRAPRAQEAQHPNELMN